ncbi:MAG TPA: hypothetical protein VH062_32135 [Polyangiaceae bacterium]|nr:hypothetical protein [Polyangiaceae bacterium]
MKNGSESAPDCGGSCGSTCTVNKKCNTNVDCRPCKATRRCLVDLDCQSGACVSGHCASQ